MIRFILAAPIAFTPIAAYAQALPAPSYRSVIITQPGSTGDVSTMSVKPTGAATSQTLGDLMAGRMVRGRNDLTSGPYQGLPNLIPFGNIDAKSIIYSRRDGTQSSILGTLAIVRNTPGSGTFGAGAADFSALLSTAKDNWSTANGSAAKEGEVDVLFLTSRQGKKGDTSSIIMDNMKRRDSLLATSTDESGAPIMLEGNVGLVDASGFVYHRMHPALGFAEGPGSTSGGRGYGALMETRAGMWFSAYHAGSFSGRDESGVSNPNAWLNYFSGSLDRNPTTVNFLVDNTGRVHSGFPIARVSYGYNPNIDALEFRDQKAATLASIGRTNRVLTAVGGIQIGSGTTVTYRNATTGAATIPSIGLASTAYLTTIGLTGAKPGDMVSAEIVSADDALSGFRVSAVVAANDNIEVRVQNLTGAVYAGGASVAFTVKAERFQ